MQQKRTPEALMRVIRWKLMLLNSFVDGHRRSMSGKAWDLLKCDYRWRRVQRGEERLRRRRCWLNWVEKAEVRVLSVNMMEGGSQGCCLCFTKAHWQDAASIEKNKEKRCQAQTGRVRPEFQKIKECCASFWTQSQELSSIQAANTHQHHWLHHHDHYLCHLCL